MQLIEIPWPGAATLMWDRDDVLDITSGHVEALQVRLHHE